MSTPTRTGRKTGSDGCPGPGPQELPALLRRVARGDEAAFEQLYRAVAGPVLGVALRTLRSPAHAEEVAQEVLLELWRTAAAYRPERGSVWTWVLTVAHRRAVDRVRSVRASAERDLRAGLRETAVSDAPEEQAVRSLEGQRVRFALGQLSAVQREAVVLAYYGGYTHSEIAHAVGVPLGTVKTRIRDGLIRLRAAVAFDAGPAGRAARPRGPATTEAGAGPRTKPRRSREPADPSGAPGPAPARTGRTGPRPSGPATRPATAGAPSAGPGSTTVYRASPQQKDAMTAAHRSTARAVPPAVLPRTSERRPTRPGLPAPTTVERPGTAVTGSRRTAPGAGRATER
ncbi:sigma-70 family RNA polymerase sigma factor [Kitasatospora sp. NPDC059646]|uniref:sigma-70 family RNA polymerase sigma factor n=1 Tax=Kitasatospora sp. NPDC059646 TaxID=3346893 RepID=UPI0036A4E96A